MGPKTVLRIRIRSDPDLLARCGSGIFTSRSGSEFGSSFDFYLYPVPDLFTKYPFQTFSVKTVNLKMSLYGSRSSLFLGGSDPDLAQTDRIRNTV